MGVVIAFTTGCGVVARSAEHGVEPVTPDEIVIAGLAEQRVAVVAAEERIA